MWTRPPRQAGAGSAHRAPSYGPCGQGEAWTSARHLTTLPHTRRSRVHVLTASTTIVHEKGNFTTSQCFPDCSVIPGNSSTEHSGQITWGSHELKRETTLECHRGVQCGTTPLSLRPQGRHSGLSRPVPCLVQSAHAALWAHLPARVRQRRSELRPTLARPPQRRLRVTARHRVNQFLQRLLDARLRLLDARLRLLDARSSGTCTANSTALGPARFQLTAPLAIRRARQPRRVRNQSIASISDGTRFRSGPDTTCALIKKRFDRSVLLNDGRFEFNIASHRGNRS